MRHHKQKTEQKNLAVKSARYVQDFSIAITFTNGETKLIDFLPLFQKFAKGDNLKYFAPQNFKKFIVKNGNIYWGKNEDLIFPIELLYEKKESARNSKEKILYII